MASPSAHQVSPRGSTHLLGPTASHPTCLSTRINAAPGPLTLTHLPSFICRSNSGHAVAMAERSPALESHASSQRVTCL